MPNKICFIEPPVWFLRDQLDPPFPLMYLAAVAEQQGWQAEIVHMETLEDPIPEADIYAVTSTSPQWPTTLELSERLTKEFPDKWSIIGGAHISACPDDFNDSKFDACVVGEGEIVLARILKDPDMLRDSKIIQGEPRDIDTIPFPARHLVDYSKYKRGIMQGTKMLSPAVSIITSRGCPYRCIFCSSHCVFGRRVRFRSIDNVVAEIKQVINTLGYRGFNFYDDTFAVNRVRTMKMCEEFAKLNIVWRCLTRADTVDRELLQIMRDSGCKEIIIGMESGSQKILDALRKGVTVEQNLRAMKMIKEFMQLKVGIIVGSPGETWETIRQTENLLRKCPPDFWNVSTFTPLPGCLPPEETIICEDGAKPIGDICKNDKVLGNGNYTTVKNVFRRNFSGDIIEIQASHFKLPIRLTPEHPVLAIDTKKCKINQDLLCKPTCMMKQCITQFFKGYKLEWVSAKDLKENMCVVFPICDIQEDVDSIPFNNEIGKVTKHIGISNRQTDYLHEKYMANRIVNGMPKLIIVDMCGDVINDNPTDEELRNVKHLPSKRYNKHLLLEHLRYFNEKEGRPPIENDFKKDPKYPSSMTYHRVFGSWKSAIDSAELPPNDILVGEEFMKLSGYYVAEGRCSDYRVEYTLNVNEDKIVDDILNITKNVFRLEGTVVPHGINAVRVYFDSKNLATFFKSMFGTGAKLKYLPHWFMKLPINKQKAFLDAYIEGDGYRHRKQIGFSTVSKNLAHQIIQLFIRQGKIPTFNLRRRKTNFSENCSYYESEVSNNNIKVWRYDNYIVLPIMKITRIPYNGQVVNLETDDGTFTTSSFLVHNCDAWNTPEKFGLKILTRDLNQYQMIGKGLKDGIVVVETEEMSKEDIEQARDEMIDLLISIGE